MLKIKNISLVKLKKEQSVSIIKDISLCIPCGRTSLILGKSGSGKTTLLRCISQIEKEYTGEVLLEGENLRSISSKKRSQVVGFVPQFFALFPHMSVMKNCALPLMLHFGKSRKQAYEEVEASLALLGMEKLAFSYPHELSGGQQQRASIVRSLMLNPTFLLFDEPTSALDPENTILLIDIIKKLQEDGRGVIISSQDMAFASKMIDNVFFLENGALVEKYDSRENGQMEERMKGFIYGEERDLAFSS